MTVTYMPGVTTTGLHDLDFDLTTTVSGPVATILVRGAVDVATSPRLRKSLALALARFDTVILDLSGVDFLDSSGLHVIASMLKVRGDLQIRDPSRPVIRILALSGLDRSVRILRTSTPDDSDADTAARRRRSSRSFLCTA